MPTPALLTKEEATKLHGTLEDAVRVCNSQKFGEAYIAFLNRYDAFRHVYAGEGKRETIHNPIFGESMLSLRRATDEEAGAVLDKSKSAQHAFAKLSTAQRLEFLALLEKKVEARKPEITTTITADTGKPLELSEKEMAKGAEWFKHAQTHAEKSLRVVDKTKITTQKPLGVTQVIGAYNYPYALAIGGIVGSLAVGNSVVVYSPQKAPNWVFPFQAAAEDAIAEFSEKYALGDALKDLVQPLFGNRSLTEKVDVVHFVGSTPVGEKIKESRKGNRTIVEKGGTNVVTVMQSALAAPEFAGDKPAQRIAESIFDGFNHATGQRCTAPRILQVQEGAEAVIKKLGALCGKDKLSVGNPFVSGIKNGPLVDEDAFNQMQAAVKLAKELGAKVYGTSDVSSHENIIGIRNNKGRYVGPVVIDWGNQDSDPRVQEMLKHEIFGPFVHVVHSFQTLDEAIERTKALDNRDQLAGAIYTDNLDEAIAYQSRVGTTSIVHNAAPKDQSPSGKHGHPNELQIGGPDHYQLYSGASQLISARGMGL